jgi:molecular chaperone GrpE
MTSDESVSSVFEKQAPPTEPKEKSAQPAEPVAEVNAVSDTPDTTAHAESTEPTEPVAQTEKAAQTDSTTANDTSAPAPEATPEVTELTRKYAEAIQKAENYWDSLLRKQAEYDNLQKRMVRDVDNARKYALEKFAIELLAVKDSMELGMDAAAKPETNLDSVREGMGLTLKMLADTMAKFSINEINPIEEKFNPEWHEAMAMQPVPNVEEGIVLHVHQKGYQLNDRLLRPARVVVAKAVPAEKLLENQG